MTNFEPNTKLQIVYIIEYKLCNFGKQSIIYKSNLKYRTILY